MFKKYNFTFGILVGLLLSFCIVFAQNITLTVENIPIKYYFNGVQKMPDAGSEGFIYNDKTYVPIRFISESLGKFVEWNENSNSITINDNTDYTISQCNYTYDVKNDNLYRQSLIDVKSLKSYSEILKDAGCINSEKSYVYPVGAYAEYLILAVGRDDTYTNNGNENTNGDFYFLYRYNLNDNTFNYIDKSLITVGNRKFEVVGNKLVVKMDGNMYIYKIDTLNKYVKDNINKLVDIKVIDDDMYFISETNNKYALFRQNLTTNTTIKLKELSQKAIIKIQPYWDGNILYCLSDDEKQEIILKFNL